jgi:hypothetical protein
MAQTTKAQVTTAQAIKTASTDTIQKLKADETPLFGKTNFLLMALGGVIIALGMFLMAGGKNVDPNVFDYNQVYSKIRVTVAPALIILGILVEVFAIFKKTPTA